MKSIGLKARVLRSALFGMMLLAASAHAAPSIVGKWVAQDEKGSVGSLSFEPGGDVDLTVNGLSYKALVARKRGTVKYTFDDSRDPAQLDIVATTEKGESKVLRAIVRFESDNTILFRLSLGGERPFDFEGGSDKPAIRLNRARLD